MTALKELKAKWLCENCGEACTQDEILEAPNPFAPSDTITACPHCKGVETLIGACSADGCNRPSSSGTPNVEGYRYVWACSQHSPYRNEWPGADPALFMEDTQ